MNKHLPEFPFSSFLNVSVVSHFIYGIPIVFGIFLLKSIDPTTYLCLFLPVVIISILVAAGFTWLIAKGSNWENTQIAIRTLSSIPSSFGGVLFGGAIGYHFFGNLGSLILAIVFMFIGFATAIPISKYMYNKISSNIKTGIEGQGAKNA